MIQEKERERKRDADRGKGRGRKERNRWSFKGTTGDHTAGQGTAYHVCRGDSRFQVLKGRGRGA